MHSAQVSFDFVGFVETSDNPSNRFRPYVPGHSSHEDIENDDIELSATDPSLKVNEQTPLDATRHRRQSMRKLVRQASTVNTQKTPDGTMQLTYWF